jgi:GTP-binding protein EngB required for normal cell division
MASRLNLGHGSSKRPVTASHILKINKYENPRSALNLIAHICTNGVSLDPGKYFDRIFTFFEDEWEPKTKDPNTGDDLFSFLEEDFLKKLKLNCCRHLNDMADDPYDTIDIAVAGGFSAGKSRLLNRIARLDTLLPTGVEPVSVVNTKIVCDKEVPSFCIRGRNLRDQKVALNSDVLDCIQHSSKSNVFVASVLQGITIYKPIENKKDPIEGITFIDTPGYNNSCTANKENDRTDKATAQEAINDADALIWCIDIDAGTITETDIQMLTGLKKNMPIVIMFTQMDKKPDDEVRKILTTAKQLVNARLKDLNILKILAYSANENRAILLKNYMGNGDQIGCLLEDIKMRCKGTVNFIRDIEKKIDDEIVASKDAFEHLEEERKKVIKEKKEWIDKVHEDNEIVSDDAETFKDLVNATEDSLDVDLGVFKDNYAVYLDYYISQRKQVLNDCIERQKEIVQQKKDEENCMKFLGEFRIELRAMLDGLKQDLRNEYFSRNTKLEEIKKTESPDIFRAIKLDDYERFIQCFHCGQNIAATNKDGYTPMTFAVKEGNNQMVQFFLDNGVNPRYCDARGYNAFETAVINHYQDLCEAILESDGDIVASCDKSLDELFAMNTFRNWLKSYK